MSKSKLIEKVLDAIDNGEVIDVDLDQIQDSNERAQVAALLKINQVSSRIKTHRLKAQADVFQPNDQWLHLIIQEKVGSGGFGQVYRAYDTVLETDVAVKFLNKDQSGIEEQEFLKEARLMATVRNPHVLAIHGAGRDKGMAGYWSDYLDGTILHSYLSESSLDDQHRLKVIQEITQAVKATHDNEVVHGDIKSLNVMLQPNRGAILLDFGSSRSSQHPTDETLATASPIAMAPEQFAGEPATPASDVYSLGLLFFEILTGRSLFLNKNMSQISELSKKCPDLLKAQNLSADWKKMLQQMLNPNPASRPDITTIAENIQFIKSKPLKRAKLAAVFLLLGLMVSITSISLYSRINIGKANRETEAINQILKSTFLTVSPYYSGEQVLLLDALKLAENKIIESPLLSGLLKQELLGQILETNHVISNEDENKHVVELAKKILVMEELQPLTKMKIHSTLGSYYFQRRELDLARENLSMVDSTPAETEKEYDQKIGALLTLAMIDLGQHRFDSFEKRKAKAHAIKSKSSLSELIKGKLAYLDAEYHSQTWQRQAAVEAFDTAAKYYLQHYHENHYDVIGALARAAAERVLVEDPEIQKQGMSQLISLIPKMNQLMGEDHSRTIIAKINLASGYIATSQPQQAIDVLLPVKPIIDNKFGPKNLLTTTEFKKYLSWAYQDSGQIKIAETTLLEIIDDLNTGHPDSSYQKLRAQIDLIHFYQETEQLDKATGVSHQALNIAQKDYSEEHRISLEIEALLVWQEFLRGNPDSLKQIQSLYKKHIQLFGEEDPQTVYLQGNLEEVKKSMNILKNEIE